LKARVSAAGGQRSQGSAPPSTGNRAFDSFVRDYGSTVSTTSFDRTFAFLAILSGVGLIPAWFLRKPEKTED
jgi:hypothetical protein